MLLTIFLNGPGTDTKDNQFQMLSPTCGTRKQQAWCFMHWGTLISPTVKTLSTKFLCSSFSSQNICYKKLHVTKTWIFPLWGIFFNEPLVATSLGFWKMFPQVSYIFILDSRVCCLLDLIAKIFPSRSSQTQLQSRLTYCPVPREKLRSCNFLFAKKRFLMLWSLIAR